MKGVATTKRADVPKEMRDMAIALVAQRMEQKMKQYGERTFISSHEIYGIMAEEMAEYLDAVRNGNQHAIKDELIDIAVAAVFGLASAINEQMDWM